MECLLCGHHKVHGHGTTSKGNIRYECPKCKKTFVETFDTGSPKKERTNLIWVVGLHPTWGLRPQTPLFLISCPLWHHLDTIYYHRHIDAEKIHLVLQSQSEGVSLRGIARLS
jgi:hypothetical protein